MQDDDGSMLRRQASERLFKRVALVNEDHRIRRAGPSTGAHGRWPTTGGTAETPRSRH
jgi:hypothetical protein